MNLNSIFTGSFINSSIDGKVLSAILLLYEENGNAFSSHTVAKLDALILRDVAVGIASQTKIAPLVAWERLRSGSIRTTSFTARDDASLHVVADAAYTRLYAATQVVQQQDSTSGVMDLTYDQYIPEGLQVQIMGIYLQALAAMAVLDKQNSRLVALIDLILSEQSLVLDEELHLAALQCHDILVQRCDAPNPSPRTNARLQMSRARRRAGSLHSRLHRITSLAVLEL